MQFRSSLATKLHKKLQWVGSARCLSTTQFSRTYNLGWKHSGFRYGGPVDMRNILLKDTTNFFNNKLVSARYHGIGRCFGRSTHTKAAGFGGDCSLEQMSYSGYAKQKRINLMQQGIFLNSGICTPFIPPQTGQMGSLPKYLWCEIGNA